MSFQNYRLWVTSSDHSAESTISKHALTVNMWKCPKHLPNLHQTTFIMFFLSSWRKLIWKMSPLVLREILGVFVITFTADAKYLIGDCEN